MYVQIFDIWFCMAITFHAFQWRSTTTMINGSWSLIPLSATKITSWSWWKIHEHPHVHMVRQCLMLHGNIMQYLMKWWIVNSDNNIGELMINTLILAFCTKKNITKPNLRYTRCHALGSPNPSKSRTILNNRLLTGQRFKTAHLPVSS